VCFKFPGKSCVVQRFKPPTPISIGAQAVHGITPNQVESLPPFQGTPMFDYLKSIFPTAIVIAHNAPFDLSMLRNEGLPPPKYVIDSLQLSYHLLPNIEQHTLQYLRYFLHLYEQETDTIVPHSSQSDVLVLEKLFNYFSKMVQERYQGDTIANMVHLSSTPALLPCLPFGKYKNMSFSHVKNTEPRYLIWMQSIAENRNLAYTLNYWLDKK